jgi:TolB-like protein
MAQPTTAPSAPLTKVLIVPFKQMGDPGSRAWVGAAIQENLISNTAAYPGAQAVALNQPLANMDSADAVKAARDAGASIVVFGSYQLSDDQLRVTGQAMDAGSGRVLATLQVTGPVTDLFKIEDTLGSQLDAALPQPPANLAQVTYGPSATATPTETDMAATPAAPQVYPDASQPNVYPQSTYVYPSVGYYDYGYPSYYPYYYPYPSIYFYGGFGRGYYYHGGYRGGWGHGYVGGGGAAHFSGGGHSGGGGHR